MGSHKHNKHETGGESARGRKNPGSGNRGRLGSTMEHSPSQRHRRTASGAAGTERDLGRSKVAREGRTHRQGSG
jgi:hypothetical protein